MGKRVIQFLFCLILVVLPGQLFAGESGGITVFVSIPPQKWLCEQLGQEYVDVKILLAKGQEPHGFEPSPKQIQALSGAHLFFTAGLVFEKEITRRLHRGSVSLMIVDTSKGIDKISMDSREHGHNVTLDPHVWLSPPNLKSMANVMATALIELDPENKPVYKKNLWLLNDLLDDLDKSLELELAPYRDASFFVFHPAFGYFADAYGLQQVLPKVWLWRQMCLLFLFQP